MLEVALVISFTPAIGLSAVPTADLKKLTAIVRTWHRPSSLFRLVKSFRKFYPQLRLLVADDSQEPRPVKGIDCLQMPSDSGRAACLNALLARVRTPYFLLVDDLTELHRGSDVEQLLQVVVDDKLDLAAGDIIACRRRFYFFTRRQPEPQHGLCEISGSGLKLRRGTRTRSEGFSWCDFVGDFYVARTNKVRTIGGWDAELHDDEREEFFVRAQHHGLRVGLVPEVSAWQWQEKLDAEGSGDRADLKHLAVAKMGLERMVDLDGQAFKAPRRARAA